MLIRAGRVDELIWDNESWIVLDVGFAKSGTASSGLGIGTADPVNMTFADARVRIIQCIIDAGRPLNLVIEAPLSVAFDINGNPIGRRFEKREGSGIRYWYLGAGATISIAALYLLHDLMHQEIEAEVRLFEGFATFKPRGISNHKADVEALRRVVKYEQGWIIDPTEFALNPEDRIESLFQIIGMDAGIPPLLVPW